MSSSLGEMHKVCGYHFSPRHYSLKTLSAAIQCCECLLVRPRDGNLTHNGDPRVGTLAFENLKMSNFPWAALPPPPSCCKPLIGALYVRRPNPIKFDCVRFPNVPWLRRLKTATIFQRIIFGFRCSMDPGTLQRAKLSSIAKRRVKNVFRWREF